MRAEYDVLSMVMVIQNHKLTRNIKRQSTLAIICYMHKLGLEMTVFAHTIQSNLKCGIEQDKSLMASLRSLWQALT